MQRRFRAEAMDGPDLDPELLDGDLRNLEALNRFFGGRSVVRRLAGEILAGEVLAGEPGAELLTVLDLGSGAGDLCAALLDFCRARKRPVRLVSLDFHPQVQAYARARYGKSYPELEFVRGDARSVPLRDGSVDLALCTLALHHFTDPDAVRVLGEMRRVTRRWAAVSDLCRSEAAYAGVWLATRFTRNPMTRLDGPVSVARAFTRAELERMAREAGWGKVTARPEAWFRMSLLYRKDG